MLIRRLIRFIKSFIKVKESKINNQLNKDEIDKLIISLDVIDRVRRSLDSQEYNLVMRPMVAHSCNDPIRCKDNNCFKWEPDRIIGDPYIISFYTQEIEKEERRKRQIRQGIK